MLNRDDNRLLAESEAGTPTGELRRRFRLPVLLSKELPEPEAYPRSGH